jgi:parallel beta-helix repeat protein
MIITKSDGITYSVSDWGNGEAIIDGQTREACFRVSNNNITIDGGQNKELVITGKVVHAGIWSYGPTDISGIKFTNLKIQNIGDVNSSEGIGIKITGIEDKKNSDYEISNNIIKGCWRYAIKISGSNTSGGNIYNNLLEGNGLKPSESAQVNISSELNAGVQNTLFHNNIVRFGGPQASGVNCNNANNKIYDNEIYGNKTFGILMDLTYNPNYSGITEVYRNKIYDNNIYGLTIGSTPTSYARIYNNLFYNNGVTEISFLSNSTNNELFSNTIYHNQSGHGIRTQNSKWNKIINNIVWVKTGYAIYNDNGTIIENHNCMFKEDLMA